ncbi:MAG: nucleoside-triphosphatase [Clostridia bacterium]|nr:nucleoside-triphosphatase [Clostridia bacterium]
MINVFLTGKINVGKSTILDKALSNYNGVVEGFKTVPYLINGEKIGYVLEALNSKVSTDVVHFVGKKSTKSNMVGIPKTFEEYGVKILKHSLKSKPNVILMDELGIFETKALNFQSWVFNCLDSSIPVVGVLKQKSTPFLNKIKERSDTKVFYITIFNRDRQYIRFKNVLTKLL